MREYNICAKLKNRPFRHYKVCAVKKCGHIEKKEGGYFCNFVPKGKRELEKRNIDQLTGKSPQIPGKDY